MYIQKIPSLTGGVAGWSVATDCRGGGILIKIQPSKNLHILIKLLCRIKIHHPGVHSPVPSAQPHSRHPSCPGGESFKLIIGFFNL